MRRISPYEFYNHALAYTAEEVAARQTASGYALAKVVMIEADEQPVMAVVRGKDKIELPIVDASLVARNARLAAEDEFIARSPECETGALPPLGNLFGLKVYVYTALAKDESIYFQRRQSCPERAIKISRLRPASTAAGGAVSWRWPQVCGVNGSRSSSFSTQACAENFA